jgi:hypothetical protein
MVSRTLSLAILGVALLGSNLKASAQNEAPRLQTGDLMPLLAGQSLRGEPVELPSAAEGHPAVVLFSFSRAGGQRAQEWIQHLSQEMPDIRIYSAIFLEAVPRPFRGVVVSGIKTRTPQPQQSRTFLIYENANAWKQQLQTCVAGDVCALLLGPESHIRWMTGGAFSAKSDQALRSQLKPIGRD